MFRLDRPEINSENYRVILRAGGKSLNILLRRYKNLSDLDQIFFYLSLLDDLIKLKVLVSPAIINLAGKPATKIGKIMLAAAFGDVTGEGEPVRRHRAAVRGEGLAVVAGHGYCV